MQNGPAEYAIDGDITAGSMLTVSETMADPDGVRGSVRYQWFRGDDFATGTAIGTGASTYDVVEADEGNSIGVRITYTDNSNENPETTIDVFASPVSFTGPLAADRTIDLNEDTRATNTVHFAVRAESLDENDVDVGIDNYMLLDANNMPTTSYRGFTIDTTSGDITLTGSLDYEDTTADGTRIILRVRATDENTPAETATLTLTVNVGDVNDNAPVFVAADGTNGLEYTPTIPENTRVGAEVARVRADDADGTAPNNAVTYSITSGNVELLDNNGDPTGAMLFSIGGDGAITLNAPLDYDTAPTSYTLTITASDGGANPPADAMTSTETVTITLTDINDVAPTIAASTDTGAVEDGDADGTDTGIRVVISDDAVDNYQFTYIHTVGFADISGFELRQVSGTTYGLYTSESFDFDGFDETIKNIGVLAMTIGVRDTLADGSTTPESIIPVRITITDINDNAPSLTVTGTGMIAEISDTASATHPAIDVAGITLTTADADTGTNAVVEAGYFSTDDARFAVVAGADANDWTLQLKANAALDFEADNPIMLTITLDDGTNPATTRDVTINVGNVDDGMAEYVVTQSGTELTVALVDDDPNSATYSGDPDGVNGGVSYRWFTTNNNGVTQIPITGITDTTSARLDVSTHTLMDGHIYGVAISYTDNANTAYTGDNAIIVLNSGVRFGESNYAISITDGAAPASVMIPDTSAMLTPPKTGVTIAYDFDTDGNPGDYFSINQSTGALTLKAAVDYDMAADKSFTLTLKATPSDTDIKPTTATVTVTLVDENDNKPSLSVVGGNTATIIENAVDANVGISFTITDADAPATNGFTANSFDIAAGAGTNAATAAKFTIVQDGDDWDLRLKPGMSLDYETDGTTGTIKLAITVNDGQANDAGLSDAETITITVTDLNDNAPEVDGSSGTAMLIEAEATNTNTDTGYSITLADDDTDAVNEHEFTILGNESNRFAFVKDGTTANQWNLVLLAGQTVDREMDGASIMLNFRVTDGNNPPLNALSTTVAITDANDNNPTVTVAGTGAIDERIASNTATITATGITITIDDADVTAAHQSFALGTANFTVTDADGIDLTGWSVVDDGNGNWVLQYDNTATALSAEDSGTISLRIWVDDDDNGNGGRSGSGIFHLTINNLDEGDASYAITGTTANNGMLSVALDTNNPDPDGLVAGSESYRWFILNSDDTIPGDGEANGNIDDAGSDDGDDSTLKLPADVGSNVYGVVVTYRDNANETEEVTVIASAVQFTQNTYTVSFNEATAKPVQTVGLVRVMASLNTNQGAKVDEYKFLKGGAGGMASSDDQGFTISASGIINFKDSVFDFDNITDKVYTLTVRASYKSGETGIATVEITITDANDIVPDLSQSGTATPIMENAAGATTGITFTVADDDTVNTITYNVAATTRNANNDAIAAMFEVDKSTGMLKLSGTNTLNREHDALITSGQISLTITAHDGARDSNAETVTITVININDNNPVVDANSVAWETAFASGAVAEADYGTSGTKIAQITATDADRTNDANFGELIYTLIGGTTGYDTYFEISADGALSVKGDVDFETLTTRTFNLEVQVNDDTAANGGGNTDTHTYTVTIGNINDNDPVVDAGSVAWETAFAGGAVAEADYGTSGTKIAQITATDPDRATDTTFGALIYTLTTASTTGYDTYFEITAGGELRMKGDVDYDTLTTKSFSLEVQVTDATTGGRTDTHTYTVTIGNENDNAPTFANPVVTWEAGFEFGVIPESTDGSATRVLVGRVAINDADGATFVGDRTFAINGAGTKFVIERNADTTANGGTLGEGLIYLTGALDREANTNPDPEYNAVTITVDDDGDGTNPAVTSAAFDIEISDVNDEPTVIGATKVLWESPAVSGTIPEGSYTAGTEIARAIVNDADAGANLEYRLTKGGSTFSIGSTDGIITFTADTDLDADSDPTSYTLAYEVRDRDGAWESSGDITLTVTDIDDEKPEFGAFTWQTGTGSGVTGEEHIRTINEDQGASPILVMSVSDPDTATARLTPTIQGGSPMNSANEPIFSFGILNNQAILSVLSSRLDYETAPNTYTLTLVVTDGTRTDTETVTINVGDINDNAPDIVVADSTPSVTARTASADTDIISGITVTDADVGKRYAQGDFELTGDADDRFNFVWDATAQTGKVVLKSGETIAAGTISLSLKVTDANPVGHAGTDTQALTITVTELVNGGTTGTAMQYDPSAADASGTLTYIDAAQVKANPVAGDYTATGATYGTATVDENGAWTYNVDNTHAMVKALTTGATLTDTFTIGVPLAAGGTGDVDVTVTINPVTTVHEANLDRSSVTEAASRVEVIQGGDGADTIVAGDGGSFIFGGYGDDTITLGDGVDVLVYRFSSIDGSWRADDGGDTIIDFERGKDKIIFVDVDTNTDSVGSYANFINYDVASDESLGVKPIIAMDFSTVDGVEVSFGQATDDNGPDNAASAIPSGTIVRINWIASDQVSFGDSTHNGPLLGVGDMDADYYNADSTKDSGHWDAGGTQELRGSGSFELLPNYFNEYTDSTSTGHLDVITLADLAIDVL